MKKIEDLKQGDIIYDIDFCQVKRYRYLCVHPTGHGKYHILINMCEDPFRIYEKKLQDILDLNLNSYQEAKLYLADQLDNMSKRFRNEPIDL